MQGVIRFGNCWHNTGGTGHGNGPALATALEVLMMDFAPVRTRPVSLLSAAWLSLGLGCSMGLDPYGSEGDDGDDGLEQSLGRRPQSG